MPHRGSLHARRRVGAYPTPFLDVHTEDGTNAMVSATTTWCRFGFGAHWWSTTTASLLD
jgi:hypothetical protein